MGELVTRWVKILLGFLMLWVGVYAWNNVGCSKLIGSEMEPTHKRDAFKLTSPKKFRPEDLAVGDIVFYEFTMKGRNIQEGFAGRVMALPGSRVRIEGGDVFVDDKKADATFVEANSRSGESREEILVPRGCVYILADNRREYVEYDSRGIGPIGSWAIVGKMWQ
jgi:signal peptidase I